MIRHWWIKFSNGVGKNSYVPAISFIIRCSRSVITDVPVKVRIYQVLFQACDSAQGRLSSFVRCEQQPYFRPITQRNLSNSKTLFALHNDDAGMMCGGRVCVPFVLLSEREPVAPLPPRRSRYIAGPIPSPLLLVGNVLDENHTLQRIANAPSMVE